MAFLLLRLVITSLCSVMAQGSSHSFANILSSFDLFSKRVWIIAAERGGRIHVRTEKVVLVRDHAIVAFQTRSDREISRFCHKCSRKEGNTRDNEKKSYLFVS